MQTPQKLIIHNHVHGFRIFEINNLITHFTEKCTALGYEFFGSKFVDFYYDTQTNELRKEKSSSIEWFIFHRGYLFRVYSQCEGLQNTLLTTNDEIRSRMENNSRKIVQMMDSVIENLDEHNEKYLEKRAAELAEKEKRAEEGRRLQEKLKEERAKAEEIEYKKAVESFNGCSKISWAHFEKLCKEKGIKIQIRTLGAARKRIEGLSKTMIYRYSLGGKKVSQSFIGNISKLINRVIPKE